MPLAYKLLRTKKESWNGSEIQYVFSLFADKMEQLPLDTWLDAKDSPTRNLAHRPGWHISDIPDAPWLRKENGEYEKGRVWALVEYKDDVNYTPILHQQGKKDMQSIPKNGFYTFDKYAEYPWIIAGEMRIVEILTPEKRQAILRSKNYDEAKALEHYKTGMEQRRITMNRKTPTKPEVIKASPAADLQSFFIPSDPKELKEQYPFVTSMRNPTCTHMTNAKGICYEAVLHGTAKELDLDQHKPAVYAQMLMQTQPRENWSSISNITIVSYVTEGDFRLHKSSVVTEISSQKLTLPDTGKTKRFKVRMVQFDMNNQETLNQTDLYGYYRLPQPELEQILHKDSKPEKAPKPDRIPKRSEKPRPSIFLEL